VDPMSWSNTRISLKFRRKWPFTWLWNHIQYLKNHIKYIRIHIYHFQKVWDHNPAPETAIFNKKLETACVFCFIFNC
jgi:hypothetical protein